MPKKTHNIMRISGWLPVSYSVYMMFENQANEEWLTNENTFYRVMKFLADYLNDHPKATNRQLIASINIILTDCGELTFRDSQVKIWIDFIRDSIIVYSDIIKQEREFVAMGICSKAYHIKDKQ
jgi:hypothetical protein